VKVRVLALLLVLSACSCTPPRDATAQQRFDFWVQWNVTVDYITLPDTVCGGYDNDLHRVVLDRACLAEHAPSPEATAFVTYHELAHAADHLALGFIEGVGPCYNETRGGVPVNLCQGWERAAQCIAEAVLGYTMTPDPAKMSAADAERLGYWDCPPDHVARASAALAAKGLL